MVRSVKDLVIPVLMMLPNMQLGFMNGPERFVRLVACAKGDSMGVMEFLALLRPPRRDSTWTAELTPDPALRRLVGRRVIRGVYARALWIYQVGKAYAPPTFSVNHCVYQGA